MAVLNAPRTYFAVKFLPLFLAVTLAACSSGGGEGDDNEDVTSPTVSSTTPANNATAVELNVSPTVTFSEDMLGTSIDTSSILLEKDGSSVAVSVNFDGSTQATLTRDAPLALLTKYVAKATTAVADLVGNPLISEASWSFTTRDGFWQTSALLENDNGGSATEPQIAVDGAGGVVSIRWCSLQYLG